MLTGRLRLLQGTTVVGSATFVSGSAQIVAALPANATYTVEIIGDAAAAFRLRVDLVGGLQEETLSIPLDITRSIAPYFVFKGSVTVAAPTTVYLARSVATAQADVRLLSAGGTVLIDAMNLPDALVGTALTLPAAGVYTVEVRPRNPAASTNVRVTLEQTLWLPVAPQLDIAGVYNISDAQTDRNGKVVVAYSEPVGNASRLRFQRWTGVAWETAAADLLIDKPCSDAGFNTNFTFDMANRLVVLVGNRSDPSTATFVPRIQADSSESRNDTTGAISAGVPGRSIVFMSSSARAPSVSMKSFRIGVSTGPGLTAFMRMPRSRQVHRFCIVQTMSASFEKK